MTRKLKSKKIFATITDLFIFSVFARVILYGCHQIGLGMQLSLLVGLLVGGIINYVLIPLFFNRQTIGMKVNHLAYVFVNSSTKRDGIVLLLRFSLQLLLNVVFLGIPLAVNLFLLVWRKDAFTLVDQLFSRVMVNQELR